MLVVQIKCYMDTWELYFAGRMELGKATYRGQHIKHIQIMVLYCANYSLRVERLRVSPIMVTHPVRYVVYFCSLSTNCNLRINT